MGAYDISANLVTSASKGLVSFNSRCSLVFSDFLLLGLYIYNNIMYNWIISHYCEYVMVIN